MLVNMDTFWRIAIWSSALSSEAAREQNNRRERYERTNVLCVRTSSPSHPAEILSFLTHHSLVRAHQPLLQWSSSQAPTPAPFLRFWPISFVFQKVSERPWFWISRQPADERHRVSPRYSNPISLSNSGVDWKEQRWIFVGEKGRGFHSLWGTFVHNHTEAPPMPLYAANCIKRPFQKSR